MFQVTFVNNSGAGYAEKRDVSKGTTIADFIAQHTEGNPDGLMIRVNREIVTRDYALNPGDKITATPTKLRAAV